MKIYIAAPWVRKLDAINYASKVVALGHEVTSRWFKHEGNPNDSTGATCTREDLEKQVYEDIEDIHNSNGMIVLNLERSEGKAVETGIALEIGMPIATVGPRGNVFQAICAECETIEQAVRELEDFYGPIA